MKKSHTIKKKIKKKSRKDNYGKGLSKNAKDIKWAQELSLAAEIKTKMTTPGAVVFKWERELVRRVDNRFK